ncbi:MAG: Peptidoglycan-binding lysin domain protein [Holophagaceae bacterium]|nr:Peptidoglycan-binding lysin domain protein [Holophagaceae bacterium]
MHQRTRLCAFTMMTCVALALAAQEVVPPRTGEPTKVAAHFSKWDYPKEVALPADAQLHLVEKGDTLWDLGNKYLSNPYAWPKIWEQNKWVKDPHWIYPGDPLIVPSVRVVGGPGAPPQASDDVLNLQPDRSFSRKPSVPEWAYSFQDFIQLPYLVPEGAKAHLASLKALQIVDSDNPVRKNLADGDRLYLDGGQDRGIKEGTRLVILKVAATKLSHPDDRRGWHSIGDVIQQCGVARIIKVNPKGSIALIERSMDGIEVGDHLAEYSEPASIPLNLRKDISEPIPLGKALAKVIYSRENHESFSGGDMVIIDKGSKDGLAMGNVLLAIREVAWDVKAGGKESTEKTNRYLGQLMVVREGEAFSTCRVLRSVEEMHVGDLVTR